MLPPLWCRRKGPVEVASGGEQLIASVTAGAGSSPGGGDRDAAGFVPQKGRAQRDVLGPVEEVVGFLLVGHGLGKICYGLAAPQAELAAEAQPRHRQAHAEGERDILRSRVEAGLLPFEPKALHRAWRGLARLLPPKAGRNNPGKYCARRSRKAACLRSMGPYSVACFSARYCKARSISRVEPRED